MRTMWEALKLCLPITLMTFAIFTRSEMVITPGWNQILNTIAMIIGTCGVAYAMFGRYSKTKAIDVAGRLGLTVLSGIVLFHPNDTVALSVSPLALAAILFGLWRYQSVAPRPAVTVEQLESTGKDEGLEELLKEGQRDY